MVDRVPAFQIETTTPTGKFRSIGIKTSLRLSGSNSTRMATQDLEGCGTMIIQIATGIFRQGFMN